MNAALHGLGRLALAMALAGAVALSHAAPVRLDDAGTFVDPPNLQLQWRTLAQGGSAKQMEGRARVSVRLDTQRHVGRAVRIYLVMDQAVGAGLMMQWQSRGLMLPGRIAPGERVLMYRGIVPTPTFEDQLFVQLAADGDWLADMSRIQFHFELETD